MGLIALFLVAITLILPKSYRPDFHYQVGKVWQDPDLSAPFDFPVYKTQVEVDRQRDSAQKQVFLIHRQDSSAIWESQERVKDAFSSFYEALRAYNLYLRNRDSVGADAALADVGKQLIYGQRLKLFPHDTTASVPSWLSRLEDDAMKIVEKIYEKGYIFGERNEFHHDFIAIQRDNTHRDLVALDKLLFNTSMGEFVSAELPRRYPPKDVNLIQSILAERVLPNIMYDDELTGQEQGRVASIVSQTVGKIAKHHVIIRKGRMVGTEEGRILDSLQRELKNRYGDQSLGYIILGQLFVMLLIIGLLITYLRINQPRIYFDNKKLGLILLTLFLTTGGMILSLQLEMLTDAAQAISFIYLAPTCLAPILVANFFDSRTGFLINLLVALLGAVLVQRGLEFAFIQIMAGTVAVYSLRRLRERQVFFFTMGYLLLAYGIAFFAYNFLSKYSFDEINFGNLILFVFNIALTILAYPLIYLFERLFGLTSDLTYLELLDTNHPLLKQLAAKAPGSFQHSLQVANISEAAIQAVGGNALLVHVGALYHDIGKAKHPSFFIENTSLEDNPHKKMDCEMSARVIIEHIPDGIALAHEYNLPKEIIEFISTHHGTTKVEYFYRKYLAENGCEWPEGEANFRYPGPKPYSKETAVLMIADSIEAASKSLTQFTEEDLQKLTNKIIDYKISEGQLENSNLTFRDITTIREVMFKQLLSIYHGRIKYPEEASLPA